MLIFTYGAKLWGKRMVEKKNKMDIEEIKHLLSKCRVTRMDRWKNEEIRCRVGVRKMRD